MHSFGFSEMRARDLDASWGKNARGQLGDCTKRGQVPIAPASARSGSGKMSLCSQAVRILFASSRTSPLRASKRLEAIPNVKASMNASNASMAPAMVETDIPDDGPSGPAGSHPPSEASR